MLKYVMPVLLLAATSAWSGCDILGSADEEEEETAVGDVYDLGMADSSSVDADFKSQNTVGPDSYGGYYVKVEAGKSYFILIDLKSGGGVTIYVSPYSQIVIGAEGTSKVSISGDGGWFTPDWTGKMYVLILAAQPGTVVETGVYTYEPTGEVPADAVALSVNDIRTEAKLLTSQTHLYYFETRAGLTYTIHTDSLSGTIDVYAGTSSTVGAANYKFVDAFGNSGIDVQYASDMTVYVIVEDRGNNLGSEYTVRVYSYEEESVSMPGMVDLTVNDVMRQGDLMPGEINRFSFYMNYGNTYKIVASSPSGSVDVYTCELACVDDQVYSESDAFGNSGIGLMASESADDHYIAVVDRGNDLGSEYTIRVVSYDESSPMVASADLVVGSALQAQHVDENGIQRYKLLAEHAKKYRVSVEIASGSTDTYLSVISSVDYQVYEESDAFSNSDIVFLAQEAGYYYVAVVDRGNEMGSDFSISLNED